jgi:choline dehydrogenase-like flavoprotein
MLIDARSVEDHTLECDLCVVGAGPAGIAIVDRLRGRGLSIVLIESGGFALELPTQELYRGEVHGGDYFRLDACRWRLFGGSSNRWGGWCRPLEPIDFTQRAWLPYSGWPIDATTLEPYYKDAADLFELKTPEFNLDHWRGRLPAPFSLENTNFENALFQFSPETNFGEVYRERILAATNVKTIIHANLKQIKLDPSSRRVGKLLISTLNGRSLTVSPKAVVLAAGGIENARLLLASNSQQAAGLGNEFDLVGRFFMEHLHVPAGHMLPAPGLESLDFYRKAFYAESQLRGVITPTADAMNRHRLFGTSIAIEPPRYSFGTPFVGWPPSITFGPVRRYKRWRLGRYKLVVEQLKRAADHLHAIPKKIRTSNLARSARARAAGGRSARIFSLYFRAEQAPNPSNRITLSRRIDALGIPQSELHWNVNPVDTANIIEWLKLLDQDIRQRGLGQVVPPEEGWDRHIIGGPHHMGTTRMSADPHKGVVDAQCRVHSVDNLYVAGSSVFSTGGFTNPTFTLVALALRLADTLQARLLRENKISLKQSERA